MLPTQCSIEQSSIGVSEGQLDLLKLVPKNVFAHFFQKPNTKALFHLLQANTDEIHVIHHAAYGDKVTFVSLGEYSELELDKLEDVYPKVISEPMYPIWQNYQPFQLALEDPMKPLPRYKLYLLANMNQLNCTSSCHNCQIVIVQCPQLHLMGILYCLCKRKRLKGCKYILIAAP